MKHDPQGLLALCDAYLGSNEYSRMLSPPSFQAFGCQKLHTVGTLSQFPCSWCICSWAGLRWVIGALYHPMLFASYSTPHGLHRVSQHDSNTMTSHLRTLVVVSLPQLTVEVVVRTKNMDGRIQRKM